MRLIKTRSSFGRYTTSLELPAQRPNLNHTTLFKFTEIPHYESPIKHCKNFLDTFKEPLQQKIFFVRQPIVSKSVDLQRKVSENERLYNNYERMVSYSTKKHSSQQVQKKILKKNELKKIRSKVPTLKQIVSNKMIEELSSQMNLTNDEENIQTVLKDQRLRQQLFEESILVDRLIQLKKQARKAKDNQHMTKIQHNPKHFHLNQLHRDIDIFYRRKFVKKCIKFNCESKISKFQLTKFRKKCEQSQILMNNLINNYSNQINTDKTGHNVFIMQTIKRLFLHYSNQDGQTQYSHKYISRTNIQQFFIDFQFSQLAKSIKDDILLKEKIEKFSFFEIIYELSSLLSENIENNVYQFLKKHIIAKQHIYIPNQCLQFNKKQETFHKYFKISKLKKKIQNICDALSKVGANDSNGERWLNFDSFHELFLTLNIYPNHISKSKMKYYHSYCQSINQAIKIDHVMQIMAFISQTNEQTYQKKFFQLIDLIKKFQL